MRGMRLGIVGSEAAKFTPATEQLAREAIRGLLSKYKPVTVVSGACHLGGIDIWAIEEAKQYGLELTGHVVCGLEHPAGVREWDPPGEVGYKVRNLRIVEDSDVVACITLDRLPAGYTGMRFPRCYHHKGGTHAFVETHVKSGGCWTMEQAKLAGKHGELVVIKTPEGA